MGSDVVTKDYANLVAARSNGLVADGWLPDVLPSSAVEIHTSNNLDINISWGRFSFNPAHYTQFSSKVRPYSPIQSRLANLAERVTEKTGEGYIISTYSADALVWVFFCKPSQGQCEYEMWSERKYVQGSN